MATEEAQDEKWTHGSQSENIYPNLIALSTLIEKIDAKVRVDIN